MYINMALQMGFDYKTAMLLRIRVINEIARRRAEARKKGG